MRWRQAGCCRHGPQLQTSTLPPLPFGVSHLDSRGDSRADRPATAHVASDLARSPRPGRHARPGDADILQSGSSLPSPALPAIVAIALGHRLVGTALFALVVVVEKLAFGTDNFGAAIAVGLEAMLADQRTHPRSLQLDRIERIDAGDLGVEPGAGVAVGAPSANAARRHSSCRRRHR